MLIVQTLGRNVYPLEKQFSGSASLDEEEEMKTITLPQSITTSTNNNVNVPTIKLL